MPTRVIGFYAKGCIAGAEALPINGDTWQVMRLSRNRNWAHPDMVALLKRLSAKAHKDAGWPGILVGDMSQPRGGPMLTGHASHQIGLDADIWLTPMPNHRAVARGARGNVRGHDGAPRPARHRSARLDAGPSRGDPRRGAGADACSASSSTPRSRRRCAARPRATAAGSPRSGRCTATTITSTSASNARPAASDCKSQPAPAEGEGCSAGDLAYWFKDSVLHPKPPKVAAEAEAADDAGAIAGRLPPGSGRAGCQAIAARRAIPFGSGIALMSGIAAP